MPEPHRRCSHCKGTGKCRSCHGTGRLALQKVGAIAPGWFADLNVLTDLKSCAVERVFKRGHLVAEKGYLLGNLLIFSGVMGSSFYNSYGKKVMERYSPMEMLFYTYVAMFIIMTPLILHQERDVFARVPHFTWHTWIGLTSLTFFHNFLSMVLFLKALKQLDAIQAALSNYLITFFGLPIAAIWLGERLTVMAIFGGILVLASTLAITIWDELRKPIPQ
jgi:drug/metabolite transporter (DMT)-like permease